jgi:hypothetical protein
MLKDVKPSRQSAALKEMANKLGDEQGKRFERVATASGETRFREFENGKLTGRTFTEEEMREAIADKLEESEEVDLLQEIRDALKGRFVNE